MITLETKLSDIRGLSPAFIKKLEKLKLFTIKDLIWHFPFRYDDFSKIANISELALNQPATVTGVIKKMDSRRTWRKKMVVVEAVIADDTGGVKAVWFNQPYVAKILRVGERVNFAGKLISSGNEVYFSNPEYEIIRLGDIKHTAGLIPIYPETKGLTSRGIRYLLKPILKILPRIQEFIPEEVLKENNLPEINTAIEKIHFPLNLREAEAARRRFSFEDLFLLQLNNFKFKMSLAKESASILESEKKDIDAVINSLPFELTDSQKQSVEEIVKDISTNKPMNRLLQGDVGSGKTVVAALGALIAAKNGKQAVFMAPTEVLARQHYETLNNIFGDLIKEWGIAITLLLGGAKNKLKSEIIESVSKGKTKIIIGTHALIQKNINFNDLAFVIIDEQHRFGVGQRAELVSGKTKKSPASLPHFLSMSATPIPRTLSLTLFGDLDVSVINELPKGRKQIITKIVAPANRNKAYEFMRNEIKKGRQAFIICPRIEQSAVGNEQSNTISVADNAIVKKWSDVKAVKDEYERLQKKVFPDLKIAMLHGKLKSKEKEEIMKNFKDGKTDILVSTSVIEVGVDVPNATIMVIEGPECFGLAQLYQFRGRIGRGEHQSYCLLFTESNSNNTKQRLDALIRAKNGFELAELDLKLRGPGEFLGEKQTGLPDLAMKSLDNLELIKKSRESAEKILSKDENLKNYPLLNARLELFKKTIHLE